MEDILSVKTNFTKAIIKKVIKKAIKKKCGTDVDVEVDDISVIVKDGTTSVEFGGKLAISNSDLMKIFKEVL